MSSALQSIMRYYARADDPAVRRNLCDALVADGTPEAAELLLDLATEDPDPQVNALAAGQIGGLSPAQLQAVQPSIAQRFSPEKGKDHILNWVRSADRVAKGTRTSLFSSLGTWRQEVRASRKLNRRLLFSRKNEYGFAARLLNRHIVISAVMAVLLTILLRWLLIDNADDDLVTLGPFISASSVLLIGIPLAVMFAPPVLAFRRSVTAYVDAIGVIKFAVVILIALTLFGVLINEIPDESFFVPAILYLVVPLVLVRLALHVSTRIRHRVAYPLLLSLITLGVLVVVYSVLLRVLDAIDPLWYEYGEVMSAYLMVSVPVALFMAIHQGSHGNQVMHTGETDKSVLFNKVRWSLFAAVATVFIALVVIAPASGTSAPGRGEVKDVVLPGISAQAQATKSVNRELAAAWRGLVADNLGRLIKSIEDAGGNRQLVAETQEILSEIQEGASFRRLEELADELLDAAYSSKVSEDVVESFTSRSSEVFVLADRVQSAAPVTHTDSRPFKRTDKIEIVAPVDGDIDLLVTARRNGRPIELVIWVNGVEIDDRPWNDPELFQGTIEPGRTSLVADVPARSVDPNDMISHFQAKIAHVLSTYMGVNMGARDVESRAGLDVDFEVAITWLPNPETEEKSEEASD